MGELVHLWVFLCLLVCVSLFWCVCSNVRLREALQMLKLCAYKKQLFHPPLYLSHAQKVLRQTVTVPCPYLRFPWRFLHPQVGNPDAPFTCPRMFRSFAHHIYITCSFGVCHHDFFPQLIHSERPIGALFLCRYACSTHCMFTQKVN